MWKQISDPVKDRIDYPRAEDLLKAYTAAMEDTSGGQMVDLFTEDAIYEYDPSLEPIVGHNAIFEQMNRQADAYERIEFTIERFWVVTSSVLASYHATLTPHGHRDHPVRVHGFLTLEMRGNLIARLRQWSEGRGMGESVDWIVREK